VNAPRYFYLHDRLGSVRQIVNSSAAVENCYYYTPWGGTTGSETDENVSNWFGWAGYLGDEEISSYYCNARQFNSARFTTRDPISGSFSEPMTLHAYLYCLNDPINRTDPTGQTSLTEENTVVGIQGTMGGSGNSQVMSILQQAKGFTNYANFRNKMMEYAANSSEWLTVAERHIHHIAGRGWGNMVRFGQNMIGSFENLISLPEGMHGQITSFFNSGAARHMFMEGMKGSLQKAISGFSFQEQLAWGMAALDYLIIQGNLAGFDPTTYGLVWPPIP
jgi:RHS repeat-associated protein